MVQVTDTQAMTISAEAVTHLRSNNPVAIPGDRLTQEFADQLNAQLAAQNGPFLERLRASLGLRVRERTIGGTPVVVITPRRVRRRRRNVAGFWVHGGGFALLSGNDYTAYRMAHDLGIVVYSVDYRRSPRAQFPVALDQVSRVHRAVLRRYAGVVAAGSSAGANLLVSSVLRARRRGGPPPRAVGLLEPAVDLRAIGDSYVANDGRDPCWPTSPAGSSRRSSPAAPATCCRATPSGCTAPCSPRMPLLNYASSRACGTPSAGCRASRRVSRPWPRCSASSTATSDLGGS
jgi:acetyl esterase/lipase